MKSLKLSICMGVLLLAGCNLPSASPVPATEGPTATVPPATVQAAAATPLPTEDLAHYDLLVVAPAGFSAALAPLIDHKNKTGMPTRLVTLDEVYNLCPGKDQAEQVKRCLALFQQKNGIKYALLVGNAANFPVRYTMIDAENPPTYNVGYHGTDLYYADLYRADGSFDDWDANANGIYGEIGGEVRPGPLNVDQVDLTPDIAVGRVPAGSVEEVGTYAAKVIKYELNAYGADWSKRMLLISSASFDPGYCEYQQNVAKFFPTGMDLVRLYPAGNACANTAFPDATTIIDRMNQGVGFVSYIGHGNMDLWADTISIKDILNLHNEATLPIVFAGGCSTGTFTVDAPFRTYVDVNGQEHVGPAGGENFSSMPPQPAVLQPKGNDEGMMKYMLVDTPAGAVTYVGSITTVQVNYLIELNTYYFEGIAKGASTAGEAWNYAVKAYYANRKFEPTYTDAEWYILADFHQPWEFMLFGDPSLRIGGVAAP